MSKLVDKLELVSRGASQPLGFRAAAMPTGPSMVLIAALGEGDAKATSVAGKSADAVLIPWSRLEGESLERFIASAGDMPWGVFLDQVAEEGLSQLRERGCDFVVFNAARAPLAILREEELAKIVEIESSLADGLLRAIDQLPIDAVLIAEESDLSVHWLMVCQHLANLVRRPLVARVPLGISQQELEEIGQIGIAGVVVNLEKGADRELAQLREAIDAMPSAKRRRGERAEPQISYPVEAEGIELEEEEF